MKEITDEFVARSIRETTASEEPTWTETEVFALVMFVLASSYGIKASDPRMAMIADGARTAMTTMRAATSDARAAAFGEVT